MSDSARQLRIVWSYRLWVAVGALLFGGLAAAYSLVAPRTYEGDALVQLIPGRQAEGQLVSPDELLQITNTYNELAHLRGVSQLAVDTAKLPLTAVGLEKKMIIAPVPDLSILKFAARDRDATTAAALSNAYASSFAVYVDRQSAMTRKSVQDQITRRTGEVERELDSKAPSSPSRQAALLGELAALQNQAATARAQVGDSARLVEEASVPTSPASPNLVINTVLGVLIGVVTGAAAGFLRHALTAGRHPATRY